MSLWDGGLYIPIKSHLRLFWWISIAISSKLEKVGWSFRGLHEMFSFMYQIKPPPNRLRSRLKTLKPKIWNWFIGNVLSSFDSEIRNKSKAFTMLSAEKNLFLIELIFKWLTIMLLALSTLCYWIYRRSLLAIGVEEIFALKERVILESNLVKIF